MTFQRFLAEWADHNAQLVDNRATLAFKRPAGSSVPQQDLIPERHSSPAKRKNADDFKGATQ